MLGGTPILLLTIPTVRWARARTGAVKFEYAESGQPHRAEITPSVTRADGAPTWDFQVLGVMPNMPGYDSLILGNLSYVDNSMPLSVQSYAWEFRVAVRDATKANDISVRIDQGLANSSSPTLTIPDKVAEIDAVNSGISVASKTWPVAAGGIFMILLLDCEWDRTVGTRKNSGVRHPHDDWL